MSIDNNELVSLRDAYFEGIDRLTEISLIKQELPNKEYIYYFDLMEYIIKKLEENLEFFLSERESATTDIEQIDEEIELLNLKLDYCRKDLSLAKEISEEEEKSELSTGRKHLIFAKRTFGGTFLENDLKNIEKENYGEVIALLEQIESGKNDSNVEKGRALVGNIKLKSICEVKGFQVRIYYKHLPNDLEYVFLGLTKKADNPKVVRNIMVERNKNVNDEFNGLLKIVQDEELRRKLIEENDQIRNELIIKLEDLGRGL